MKIKGRKMVHDPKKALEKIVQSLTDELIINSGPLISGSLRDVHLSCGKPNCKCSKGELHGPYLHHGYRVDGKFRNQTVPRKRRAQVEEAIAKYLRVRRCFEALSTAWRHALLG